MREGASLVARGSCARASVFTALLFTSGCAVATPTWTGAGTTPKERLDTWVGVATRVPVAPSASEVVLLRALAPSGPAPALAARYGLSRQVELGVRATGTRGGPELRAALLLQQSDTFRTELVVGAHAFAGALVADAVERTTHLGAEVPVVLAILAGGLYEVWVGARVAIEHVGGSLVLGGATFDATVLRAGGLFGLAIGFRPLAFGLELAVEHEAIEASSGSSSGLVLTPSFAMRLRF